MRGRGEGDREQRVRNRQTDELRLGFLKLTLSRSGNFRH